MMTSLTLLTVLTPVLAADLDGTPAEFVKWALVFVSFLISNWVMLRKAQGTKADPVHVQSPLEISQAPRWAEKAEMEKELRDIEGKVEAMARENLRAHNNVQSQVQELMKQGQKRAETILQAMHDMETRISSATLKEVKDLHQRVNPLSEEVAGNSASIRAIEARLGSGRLVGK